MVKVVGFLTYSINELTRHDPCIKFAVATRHDLRPQLDTNLTRQATTHSQPYIQ